MAFDPLLRRVETPFQETFYPLGFPLKVETNDQRVIDHAEASFGVFLEADQPVQPLNLRVLCVPDATAGPPWPQQIFRGSGDLFSIVSTAENFLVADLERGQGAGYFSAALIDNREYFCRAFLECFTYTALQRRYITPFHAACVVRNGRGICLSGPPGSGKSSLAYVCTRAGYGLLSDDAVYLLNAATNRSDTHQVRGNPSRFHLRPEGQILFPELSEMSVTIRGDGEEILALRGPQMFPGRLVTQAELGAIVFLDRRPDTFLSLEEVTPEETHRLLFDDCPLVDEDRVMREHERILGRVAQAGAFRMRYATFEQALECLDRLPLRERTVSR